MIEMTAFVVLGPEALALLVPLMLRIYQALHNLKAK